MTSCFDLPTWKGDWEKESSLHLWLHKFCFHPPAFSLMPLPENLDSRYFQTHPTEMLAWMVFHCVQPILYFTACAIFGGTSGLYLLDASIPSHSHAGTTTRVCRHWQLPWGQALPELKTMFYTIILPALQEAPSYSPCSSLD